MNGTLSFCERRLSGGDTQTLPAVVKKRELFALTGGGNAKTSRLSVLVPLASEPPCETFTIFLFYRLF